MNNISMEKIVQGIKEFELTKKRMEIKKGINNSKIINDCYNANEDSMTAAIEYLGAIKNKRKIAVLGDMLELGAFEEEMHKKIGREIYINKIDILFTYGNASKFIAAEAINSGMNRTQVFVCETKEELIEKLKNTIKAEDCILIKASNSMHFEEITKELESK